MTTALFVLKLLAIYCEVSIIFALWLGPRLRG